MTSRSSAIARVFRASRRVARAQAELLEALACLSVFDDWEQEGAHDAAHWASQVLQVSHWRAERWIQAGVALSGLPHIREAFREGQLSLYAVMELCRFAEPEEEDATSAWATQASFAQIKRAAEMACTRVEEARSALSDRYLAYRYTDEGQRFELHAELPGAEGAIVASRLDSLAKEIPVLPGEESHPAVSEDAALGTRRADALVALCAFNGSEGSLDGAGAALPTVHVHATLDALSGLEASEVEGGPPICRETLERLLCNAKVRGVLEDEHGNALRLGRTTRQPSKAQLRQLRHRDRTCTFPGCSHRRFTQAHHVLWWSRGGKTDLENLALVCWFHHTLVHEHGWRIEHDRDEGFAWFKPDGVRYRAGPSAA